MPANPPPAQRDPDTAAGTTAAAARAAAVRLSPAQLAWHEMELTTFIHFGPNTFTGKDWGDGTESPDVFQPSDLDPHQWVDVSREIGSKMLIFTAKHHDGFCL